MRQSAAFGSEVWLLANRISRLWQIDCIRGIAVVLMVFYHFMWDMHYFGLYSVDVAVGAWHWFSRVIAVTFMLLVGVSLVLSAQRRSPAARDRRWLERAAKLYGWALVITAVTWYFVGDEFVLFGILHLIATALLLAPLLWRIRPLVPWLGVLCIGLGLFLTTRPVAKDSYWLIPLGLSSPRYATVDYYPLFPWLGVIMLGMAIGPWIADRLQRAGAASSAPPQVLVPLVWAGRHSLAIYIAHQPLLLTGFWLLGYTMW